MIIAAAGDERMLTVCGLFAKEGAECRLLASDGAFEPPRGLPFFASDDTEKCFCGADAAVLPFPAFKNGLLNAPLCKKAYTPEEVFAQAGSAFVLGGGLPEGADLFYDYARDEKLLLENALITAEGAVYVLMQSVKRTVCGMKTAVAGSGRIGRALAEKLFALGAEVSVLARDPKARAEARARGYKAAGFEDLEAPLSDAGVLFNTVPRRVFGRGALSALPEGARYIELASAPGGAAREDAYGCGLEYIAAPGLPGKYAPVSAGEALFRCVKGVLRERGIIR